MFRVFRSSRYFCYHPSRESRPPKNGSPPCNKRDFRQISHFRNNRNTPSSNKRDFSAPACSYARPKKVQESFLELTCKITPKKVWVFFGLTAPQGPLGKKFGVYFWPGTSVSPGKNLGCFWCLARQSHQVNMLGRFFGPHEMNP